MRRKWLAVAALIPFFFNPCLAALLPTHEEPGVFVVHPELIPKGITIVQCRYDFDVVGPGTTFGFDIVGSGFDDAFYKIISIDPDALDVTVKNLRLITPNQIHGQIEVGPEATTQYIHPQVIIKALPVFRAPDPFGVVRRGEVLDVQLTSIDETGQWGRFQIITNLDEKLFSQVKIEPTNPRLDISTIKPQYPFYVTGVVMISEGLKNGHYGLVVSMANHELFRQDPLVDVVKPTVGKTGSIERVKAKELAHRPGDLLELEITGSAFTAAAAATLTAQVTPFAMGPSSITYTTQGLLNATIRIPPNAPVGPYGVTILTQGKVLEKQPSVFAIVPANWLSMVKLSASLSPGKNGQLYVVGRDIAPAYVKTLTLETDTDLLKVTNLRWQDTSTLVADIQVSDQADPGDYLIHVATDGKALRLPRGNIIKITR